MGRLDDVYLLTESVQPDEDSFTRIQLSSQTPETFIDIPLFRQQIRYSIFKANKSRTRSIPVPSDRSSRANKNRTCSEQVRPVQKGGFIT